MTLREMMYEKIKDLYSLSDMENEVEYTHWLQELDDERFLKAYTVMQSRFGRDMQERARRSHEARAYYQYH